jgi:copper chaperone NosL
MILAGCVLALTACRRDGDLSPPAMHYGVDPCEACGMIISDERYAAAALIDGGREGILAIRFDDIGCIFEYEEDNPEAVVLRRYVHDHGTKEWLDADAAVLVHAETLRTPMATGLAAFADRAKAAELLEQHPGETLSFADLRARRVGGGTPGSGR